MQLNASLNILSKFTNTASSKWQFEVCFPSDWDEFWLGWGQSSRLNLILGLFLWNANSLLSWKTPATAEWLRSWRIGTISRCSIEFKLKGYCCQVGMDSLSQNLHQTCLHLLVRLYFSCDMLIRIFVGLIGWWIVVEGAVANPLVLSQCLAWWLVLYEINWG